MSAAPFVPSDGQPGTGGRPAAPSHLRFRLRGLPVLLLVLLAAGALPSRPAAAQQPAPSSDSHLQTVTKEYGLILDTYYDTLPPAPLLNAAWDGAMQLLKHDNVSVTTPRPQLSGDRAAVQASFSTGWQALFAEVGQKDDFTNVAFAADDNMANSLNDDHTYFLDPQTYNAEQATSTTDSTSVGYGISVQSSAPHFISDIAPGGPGYQAGLRLGDTITAVNGKNVESLSGSDFFSALSAPYRSQQKPSGTQITVDITRPDAGQYEATVTIGPYKYPVLQYQVLPSGAGYIKLRSFDALPYTVIDNGETILQELDDALNAFEAAGSTSWILDLRGNGGGYGVTGEAVIGKFLPQGLTDVTYDQRNHRSEGLANGHPFPVQRPLAVLVDGGSASESEVTSSALKEYGRAILVGEKTAGALGTGLLFPLPDGAGINVTVAQTVSGRDETPIDGVGVDVDVPTGEPTATQLARGQDPAIVAAVSALAAQEPFTVPASTEQTLSQTAIKNLLTPYEVATSEVPTAPNVDVINSFGDFVLNSYEDWVNWEAPAEDALATRDLAAQRGWQGALLQFLGTVPNGPGFTVEADVYATAAGAAAALSSNDAPDFGQMTDSPITLGDQTVAYMGQWLAVGGRSIGWRHGRLLLSVGLSEIPGDETFAPLITLANAVEAHYQANPLPDAPATP